MRNEADFTAFAEANAIRLRQIAYLMCRDWHLAQDLTQTTLTKMYLAWNRLARQSSDPFSYARKVLLNTLLDHKRLRSSSELTVDQLPDRAEQGDSTAERLTLLDALELLPRRDRAIVLLRYWEDQSVEATAEILGLSNSVVKSQSMRALAVLRQHLGDRTLLGAATGDARVPGPRVGAGADLRARA
ncbi:sigma-70 family RNA polymerase sigma factor [Kitasatospora kifunensis]|uniref:RNA polymerase sigma-70 factor (Sigma-E family) n=1 Tax=Kitasatospora kifunensis TaxID=58351 RepID=A0A7W7R5I7_KITKI|nr:sigma-70 family RNA polymerase sigma factor [Kitasatospora kifunensis]MBB4925803.1 RNA polymerase sigma-70 factor (sigma-E family) [Kitasatospora kifunensis]